MLLLACLYDLSRSQANLDGKWQGPTTARMLSGKTLGILGYDAIARGVVRRLEPWGARLLIHARTPPKEAGDLSFVPLETLLRESDALLVLASLNATTYHLINAERLAWMKRGAIIVNTARGAIIVEAALVDALASGVVARAALDIFESEPLPNGSALRGQPNVLLTPHCAGHTVESLAAIPIVTAKNVETVLRGEIPGSLRNPQVLQSNRTGKSRDISGRGLQDAVRPAP